MSTLLQSFETWLQKQHDLSEQRDSVSSLLVTAFTLPIFLVYLVMPFIAVLNEEWAAIYQWNRVPYVQALILVVCLVQGRILLLSWERRFVRRPFPLLSTVAVATIFVGLMALGAAYEFRDSPLMMMFMGFLVSVRALFRSWIYKPVFLVFAVLFVAYEVCFWADLLPRAVLLNNPIYVGEPLTAWWAFWLRIIYLLVAFPTMALFFFLGYFMIKERQDLERLVATDSLTGLSNRGFFMQALKAQSEKQKETHERACILMCDVDFFKRVNDTWGHPMGDAVLKVVGEVLQQNVRANIDMVARIGGEEFVVLLPNFSLLKAKLIAEKIRSRVAEHTFECGGEQFHISLSIGVAQIENGDSSKGIRVADKLLYCAKALGRNCVVVQRPYLNSGIQLDFV